MSGFIGDTETTAAEALEQIEQAPELFKLYRAARDVITRRSGDDLRSCYELGRIGLTIEGDPTRNRKSRSRRHGDGAINLVATALGMHRSTFYRAIAIVKVFTPCELDAFLKRKNAEGYLITPGHLRLIAPVHPPAVREQLVESFYANSPTVRDLSEQVRLLAGPRRPAEPRSHDWPKAVVKVGKIAQTATSRLERELAGGVIDGLRLLASDASEAGPDELDQIDRMVDRLQALRDVSASAIAIAAKARAALDGRLAVPA
jgi:hypothetical protein